MMSACMRRVRVRAPQRVMLVAGLAIPLVACDAPQSILHPAGPAARGLATLGWFAIVVFSLAIVVVWALLAWIAMRRRGTFDEHDDVHARDGQQWILIGGVIIPVITLGVTLVLTLRTMSSFPLESSIRASVCSAVTSTCPTPVIEVTGHQWWFGVRYLFDKADDEVRGTTEIHIPVGRPMDIALVTRDVIHSFWVPRLHGKVDLVPGQTNYVRLQADAPGVYDGQCGEFCGVEHANMRVQVVAQTPEDYAAWLAHQRTAARAPVSDEVAHGRDVFMGSACALCHMVRGTPAMGLVGPELTHVGSQRRIAGGMLDNTTANLAAWVTHAQSIKPGAQMPDLTMFTGRELRALVGYLQSLQ
jgi:cytochrome c oxidase subunit 2